MEELKVLIDEQTIQNKVYELAQQIEKDYEQKELTLVCILKGSTVFMVDLARKMNRKVKFSFMQVSSYGKEKISSGKINLKLDGNYAVYLKINDQFYDTDKVLSFS